MKSKNKDNKKILKDIADVLKKHGLEGTSLSMIENTTKFSRASIYHRFPGGKEEIAIKALEITLEAFEKIVIVNLRSKHLGKEQKIENFISQLNLFYNNGNDSCLLNIMAQSGGRNKLLSDLIEGALTYLIEAITEMLKYHKVEEIAAEDTALHVVSLIQGGLVLSRGLHSQSPFQRMLIQIKNLLQETIEVYEQRSVYDK